MDITTLAAANAYTDEKVGAGGGESGGGVKIIDFTKYMGTRSGYDGTWSFNELILMCYGQAISSGAANTDLTDTSAFWQDVDSAQFVKFKIDAAVVARGMTIESIANSVTKLDGRTLVIESTFLLSVNNKAVKVMVLIGRYEDVSNLTTYIIVNLQHMT